MNQVQLACVFLIASAMVLAGLLVTQVRRDPPAPQAFADQVITTGAFSLMTAKTRKDEEALFMLDTLNQKLLIYRLDLGKKRLVLAGSSSIEDIFGRLRSGDSSRGGR